MTCVRRLISSTAPIYCTRGEIAAYADVVASILATVFRFRIAGAVGHHESAASQYISPSSPSGRRSFPERQDERRHRSFETGAGTQPGLGRDAFTPRHRAVP